MKDQSPVDKYEREKANPPEHYKYILDYMEFKGLDKQERIQLEREM